MLNQTNQVLELRTKGRILWVFKTISAAFKKIALLDNSLKLMFDIRTSRGRILIKKIYEINVANFANTSSITLAETLSSFLAFRAAKSSALG
jgi:hypothetical protein